MSDPYLTIERWRKRQRQKALLRAALAWAGVILAGSALALLAIVVAAGATACLS